MANSNANWTDAEARAERDLETRTLSQIEGQLARLIYVASTRDYRTGEYRHDGLAWRFSEEAAAAALAKIHQRLFNGISCVGIAEIVLAIEEYLKQQELEAKQILTMWRTLPAYSVLVPTASPHLCSELFLSNVRIALRMIEERLAKLHETRQESGV